MSNYQRSIDENVKTLVEHYGITGKIAEGGPSSSVYVPENRVFTAEVKREGRHEAFPVYVGVMHPNIDFLFALRWIVDSASQMQEETYERWVEEDGSFYVNELGEDVAHNFYN